MIHALTLTWNGLDKLQALQPGLFNNLIETGESTTWYVRDNGSKDNTAAWLENLDRSKGLVLLDRGVMPKTKTLAMDHNRANFAQGVNSLVELANPADDDVLLLVNNDVEFPEPDSISKMLQLLNSTPNSGVVGARLLYTGNNKLQHAGVIFGPRYGNMPYHYRHQEESDAQAEKNRKFQAVTAAICMVRAGDFKKVGGMDEKFSWAFEDIDMCLAIGQLGKQTLYCGGTKIYHQESATLKKNPQNKLFQNSNVKHFKEKWTGKYKLDHELYLKDPNHNVVE